MWPSTKFTARRFPSTKKVPSCPPVVNPWTCSKPQATTDLLSVFRLLSFLEISTFFFPFCQPLVHSYETPMYVRVLVTQFCLTVGDPMVCPWRFSRQEYCIGCQSLLQGIFSTQGMNWGLLHWSRILYHLGHQGSPIKHLTCMLNKQISRLHQRLIQYAIS